jgi:hypothetical protein
VIGEDEIECQYPAWIERGMEAHKEWQERETDRLLANLYMEVGTAIIRQMHPEIRKEKRYSEL